jgi:GT2 family glycosyltransferase
MKETPTVGSGGGRQQVEESLREEVESLAQILDRHERTIASLGRELDLHKRSMGWRLQQRLIPFSRSMLAVPVLRQIYRALYRAMEIWVDEGFLKIFVRAADKLALALRGKNFLVEGYDRRPPPIEDQYELWIRQLGAPPAASTMHDRIGRFTTTPLVSVLSVCNDETAGTVQDLVTMLEAQFYGRWELCVAIRSGGSSAFAEATADRRSLGGGRSDPPSGTPSNLPKKRVRITESATPLWSDAFRLATGDYVAFIEPGDELAPEALSELIARLQSEPDLDVVYSDEDSIDIKGRREEPIFKPDWSPDLLLSTNYLQRCGLFRRDRAAEVGAFAPDAGLAQPYDFALRLTERTTRIGHVPRVLYHSRRRPVTVDDVLARRAANHDESRALVAALARRHSPGRTSAIFARRGPRCYATRLDLHHRPLVSIIVPTKDKRPLLETTLKSIWTRTDYDRYEIIVVDNQSTDADAVQYLASLPPRCQVFQWSNPFNYSAINNFGVRHARGEQLLFLNNDVEVIRPDWLTAMLEHAQRPEVGAIGARLLYADGRIQHAGVVVGINRVAANAFRTWPGEATGSLRLADLTRNTSAVTGACMMVPRRIFDEVGGFDEELRVVLNDVDLCLKIRERGYLVVYTPHALLYHYEGSSRGRLHPPPDEKVFENRWSSLLDRGDPYYNPNLTDRHDDWRIKIDVEKNEEQRTKN